MKRDSFVFYRSFYEALERLTAEDRLATYDAVMQYAINGIEPEIGGIGRSLFCLMRPQLDANNRRYAAGCRGGRPRKNSKTNGFAEEKPNENENDNDNENANVNEKENENETVSAPEAEPAVTPAAAIAPAHAAPGGTVSLSSKKGRKERFGSYGNVRLTAQEYRTLCQEFSDADRRIEALDEYMAASGKRYSSHLAVIRSWARKEKGTIYCSYPTGGGARSGGAVPGQAEQERIREDNRRNFEEMKRVLEEMKREESA